MSLRRPQAFLRVPRGRLVSLLTSFAQLNAGECDAPAPPAGHMDLSSDELRTAAAAGLVAERGPVHFTRGPADC